LTNLKWNATLPRPVEVCPELDELRPRVPIRGNSVPFRDEDHGSCRGRLAMKKMVV